MPGVVSVVPIERDPRRAPVQSARRGRRHREEHVGGHPGTKGAEDRLGRRPERGLRFGGLSQDARSGGGQAGQGRPQRRRRRPRPWAAPRRRSRRSTTCRTSRTRRWSRRPRRPSSPTASARCGAASSRRRRRATSSRSGSGMPVENVTVHVTLLGGGFGRKSKPDFGIEAAVLAKAMEGKPVKVVWTRDDDLHNDYFHTVSVEHLEAGVDAKGKPVAWLHRSVAPTIMSTFDAKRGAGGELGARDGRDQRPLRDSQHPHRESGGHRAHAHRLVPFGLEHPPRVRGAVVRRRARRGGGARPEGLSAGGDRPAALVYAADAERHVEPRRVARALSGRHRAAAARGGDGGARGAAGAASCRRATASASPRTTAS